MTELSKAKSYFRSHLQDRLGAPRGCTEAQVTALEQQVGYPFPAAYREYLLWMGLDKTGVFRGSDWYASDVLENTAYVPDLLAENGIEWRPKGPILCFFCHQGYMIGWFDLPADDADPPCYFFSEGKDMARPEQTETFSEFLLSELTDSVAVRP